MADLATWTISYSASAGDLSSAQASVDRDTAAIRAFFEELGFPADALQPTGVNVSSFVNDKQATQGYFEINARDGDGGGWGVADTPFKQVRVVTTIDFYLR